MRFLILILILLIPEVSESNSFQLKAGGVKNSFGYPSNEFNQNPLHSMHIPKPEQPIHKPGHKPGHQPRHGWYGPPYYLPPYNVFRPSYGGSRNTETIIIKEKEVIREVPVIIQPPEPEKVWVPPVYETKIVEGHFTNGIKETIEDGYRTFTDDPGQSIWVPEREIRVIKTPGYYR